MLSRQPSTNKLLAITLMLLLSSLGMGPAKAQYSPFGSFGYSPLTGSSNLFWPMRMLMSPGSMLWRGGYGYNAPGYIANTLTYNAAYAAGQGANAVGRQNYMNHYWNQANGINAPVVDQISMAPWYYPPRGVLPGAPIAGSPSAGMANAATINSGASGGSGSNNTNNNQIVPSNSKGNEFMPIPASLGDSSPLPIPAGSPAEALNAASTIPAAPDFRTAQAASAASLDTTAATASTAAAASASTGTNGSNNNNNTSAAQQSGPQTGSSNPFAQAFIDHVNSKFSGDISKALSDKQTRGYAQALGILEHGPKDFEIPADRIELIKRIMQDPEEDSLTKVNTIRLLIKH